MLKKTLVKYILIIQQQLGFKATLDALGDGSFTNLYGLNQQRSDTQNELKPLMKEHIVAYSLPYHEGFWQDATDDMPKFLGMTMQEFTDLPAERIAECFMQKMALLGTYFKP